MKLRSLGIGAAICLLTACAASDQESAGPGDNQPAEIVDDTPTACVPGHQTICACPGGGEGIQVCSEDGAGFSACDQCQSAPDPMDPTDPGDPCGDGMCADDESCHTCADDCGTCAPCEIAPSCNNATVPPASLPHWSQYDVPKMEHMTQQMMEQRLADLVAEAGHSIRVLAAALDDAPASDEHGFVTALREVFDEHPVAADALRRQLSHAGMVSPKAFRAIYPEVRFVDFIEDGLYDVVPPGGTMECGAPLLRMAVSSIRVHEEDDDIANDIVYCVVQAEAGGGAEIRVTPKTPNLDEGESHTFALEAGVFWGQQGPTTPAGNVLVTYDCIEADTTGGYQALINAIGMAAGQIGNSVQGENGWIFDTAAAIAPVVSTGLALDQDDHLFNAQQTIDLADQLELTNGAFWTVRRDGTHLWSDWDWELTIKAWGCAEYGVL